MGDLFIGGVVTVLSFLFGAPLVTRGAAAYGNAWGFLFLFLALCVPTAFLVRVFKRDRQRLSVTFPVPLGCDEETAHLLLDKDDAEIYRYLARHGQPAKSKDKIAFTYGGPSIYSKNARTFEFDGYVYIPKALTISGG
jgi:hypothetical protein